MVQKQALILYHRGVFFFITAMSSQVHGLKKTLYYFFLGYCVCLVCPGRLVYFSCRLKPCFSWDNSLLKASNAKQSCTMCVHALTDISGCLPADAEEIS